MCESSLLTLLSLLPYIFLGPFIFVKGKSLDHGVDETNIPESFAAPMMIRQGDPLVLHCYELFFPSTASISNSLSFNAGSTAGTSIR